MSDKKKITVKYDQRIIIILSALTMLMNFSLFVAKYYFAYITNSYALRAEALNNLSDVFLNLVLALALMYSRKPADCEHPYGHARFEYLSSIGVSIIIAAVGLNLLFDIFSKYVNQNLEQLNIDLYTWGLLLFSIFIKSVTAMLFYKYYKLLQSETLFNLSKDSLFDIISSIFIILSFFSFKFLNLNFDIPLSLLLAIFMIITAIKSIRKMISNLLGESLDLKDRNFYIHEILKFPYVMGVHDILLHQYGYESKYMSCHLEISAKMSLVEAHELADKIEKYFLHEHNIKLLTHMDPIDKMGSSAVSLKKQIEIYLNQYLPEFNIHEFRFKKNGRFFELSFELMISYSSKIKDGEFEEQLKNWFMIYYPQIKLEFILERGEW